MDIDSIHTINDLKREVLEEFITELPDEDKEKLRQFLKEHPAKNAAAVFSSVRSYIYNTYFRKTPIKEKKIITFADTLQTLLDTNINNI